MRATSGGFASKSINSIATQFLLLVASVIANIITARTLGAVGRGQLALLLLIPALAMSFGRMGIGHAVNYYASRISTSKLITNSLVLSFTISVLIVIAALPAAFGLKDVFFRELNVQLIIVLIFCIPLFILHNHFMSLLQGLYKIEFCNALLLLQSFVNILLLVVFLLIFELGLHGALIAAISSLVFVAFVAGKDLIRDFRFAEARLDGALIRQLLNFGFKSHIGNVLKDFSYRADILIISYFLSARDVGYYVTAVIIAEILWKIPDAVGGVLLPRIANLDRAKAWSFTPIVSRLVIAPVLVGCIALFSFGKSVIELAFGEAFMPSYVVLVILLPGALAISMWKIFANDLIAQGLPIKYSLTSAIALVTMIILNLLLIPKFGINGAALASTVSYVAAAVSIMYIYMRLTGNCVRDLIVPKYSDIVLLKGIRFRYGS